MLNRRSFLKSGLTAGIAPLAGSLSHLDATPVEAVVTGVLVEMPQRSPSNGSANVPWQRRVRRVGQTNSTEYDQRTCSPGEGGVPTRRHLTLAGLRHRKLQHLLPKLNAGLCPDLRA